MTVTYLNRYDRANQAWKALKFIAGRGVQSAELNELQAVLFDELHELGRTIWSDGQVVRGCELVIEPGLARLTAGTLYFAGVFHDFPGGTVVINNTGLEVIGMRFTERIVTEADNPTLHDPASGWENSGYSGSHRLVYDLTVTRNAADAVSLYAIRDGLFAADYRPQPAASDMAQTLARRTSDESGDYLVRGLKCSVEAKDAAPFWLMVGDGKAYVGGMEFSVPSRTRLAIDRPLDAGAVLDEPKTYLTGTNLYALNSTPVKQITGVTATVEKTDTVTKGDIGGQDLMQFTPLASVVSVSQGQTTYTPTTDYVVNGNYIDWSPGGAEPSTGSSYTVVLRYIKQMVVNTDYTRTGNQVDFSPAGDNPVHNTTVFVDYDYYLTRKDLLVMTRRGVLVLVRGQPSQFPREPTAPIDTLPVCIITLPANAALGDVVIEQADRYRLTMQELAQLRARLAGIEYNLAVDDLEQEAINVQLATSKKAIYTDSFRDDSKMDPGDPDLSCVVGVAGDALDTLYPGFAVTFHDLGQPGRFIVRDYTLAELSRQPYATHQINVNPHTTYNILGVLALEPPADIWIEDVTVTRTTEITRTFGEWQQWTDRSLLSEEAISGVSVEREVVIHGSNYYPYSDNIKLVFDGILTPLFPEGTTLPGSDPESVRADVNGTFDASFTVEAGTASGTHSVLVYNEDNRGVAQYSIDGRRRTWLDDTTIIRIDDAEDGPGWASDGSVDPVAQTFSTESDVFLAAVDVYFGAKDANIPVAVSARNVINGYPGRQVLAEATLTPADVSVSVNGSAATRVTFAEPAYLRSGREHAMVVASLSGEYYLHYARLGFQDLITNNWVLTNPVAGVMFSSANAQTWTAYQEQDLKFVLWRADFGATDKTITLANNLAVDGSLITIMATEIVPVGCEILWEIRADADTGWTTVPANELVDLGRVIAEIDVRVTLKGTATLSPIIASTIGLVVAKWDASGVYVGRNVDLSAYTTLRVYLDASLPSGAAVQPKYSIDGGDNWVTCGSPTSSLTVSPGWVEYGYEVTGLDSPVDLKMRLDLTVSADRVRPPRIRRLRAIAT